MLAVIANKLNNYRMPRNNNNIMLALAGCRATDRRQYAVNCAVSQKNCPKLLLS